MTDTRPHFYFQEGSNDWYIVGENFVNGMTYLTGYIMGNNHILDNAFTSYNQIWVYWIDGESYENNLVFVVVVDATNFEKIERALEDSRFDDTFESILLIDSTIEYTMSDTFSFPDGEVYIEPSSSTTWTINNKTVKSLHIGQKEVKTIERDGTVIYEK